MLHHLIIKPFWFLSYLSCSYATKFLPCTTEQGKPDTQMLLQFDGT